jgi:hypothetical protein
VERLDVTDYEAFKKLIDEVAMGMPASLCYYADQYLYKSGGAHNLKHYLENPVETVDESILPGWTNVRKLMDRKKRTST